MQITYDDVKDLFGSLAPYDMYGACEKLKSWTPVEALAAAWLPLRAKVTLASPAFTGPQGREFASRCAQRIIERSGVVPGADLAALDQARADAWAHHRETVRNARAAAVSAEYMERLAENARRAAMRADRRWEAHATAAWLAIASDINAASVRAETEAEAAAVAGFDTWASAKEASAAAAAAKAAALTELQAQVADLLDILASAQDVEL